jgi:hypothetical protein
MKDARVQMFATSTSNKKSLAEVFDALRRGIVIFLKDAERYLYFSIARFIFWRELRRKKRSGNGNDE